MKKLLTLMFCLISCICTYATATPQVLWFSEINQLLFLNSETLYEAGQTIKPSSAEGAPEYTITTVWSGDAVVNTPISGTDSNNPGWLAVRESATSVVFDKSFADARPKSAYRWFSGFTALTSVKGIENLNLSEATTMSMMFNQCGALTSINLSNSTTSNVTDMSKLFRYCVKLKSIDISNLNTSSVTNMAEMFSQCTDLTSIDLSKLNTSNVTNMYGMFSECVSLTTIDLEHFNTEKVTNMSQMFYECDHIATIDLTHMSTASVTDMSAMFQECQKLTTIYCNDNWGGTNPSSNQMFMNCYKLVGGSGLTYSDNNTTAAYANPTSGYFTSTYAAIWCADEKTLYFTGDANFSDTSTYQGNAITNLWRGNKVLATGSGDPEWRSVVKSTATNVVFDASFASAKPTSTANWFNGFSQLTTITGLENLNTSEVTNMNNMFMHCALLTTLNVTYFDVSKVTNAWGMFNSCSVLTTIYCDRAWTNLNNNNAGNMFKNSTNLVGDSNFTYDSGKIDGTYARPGGYGYFTLVHTDSKPYALWCEGNKTLYFTADGTNYAAGGTHDGQTITKVWSGSQILQTGRKQPEWVPVVRDKVEYVVFEGTFINVLPTSTQQWFDNCKNIKQFTDLEYLNTSKSVSMRLMFYNVYQVSQLDLSHFDTSNVTDMSGMFKCCGHLTSLDLSSFNTSKVTNMTEMFHSCSGIRNTFNISSFDTSNVTDMSYMFYKFGAKGFNHLDLGNFNTSKVTNMAGMFSGAEYIQTFNLSSFNTSRVTNMYIMFCSCHHVTSLDLSNFDTSNVTNMGIMFGDCWDLWSLNVKTFDTSKVTDMKEMFSGCNFPQIDIRNFDVTNVTDMDNMFSYCINLLTIYCNSDWRNTSAYGNNMFFWSGFEYFNTKDHGKSHAYPGGGRGHDGYFTSVPDHYAIWCADATTLYFTNEGVYNPGDTFRGNTVTAVWNENDVKASPTGDAPAWSSTVRGTVTNVVIENTFKRTKPTSLYGWFAGCEKLTTITGLEYLTTKEATTMAAMFANCKGLTSLDIDESLDSRAVTDMHKMFYGCSGLTSLIIGPKNVTKVTNTSEMFSGCSKLTSLALNDFCTLIVTNMQGMFYDCSELTSLNVGGSFDTRSVTNMAEMFYNCKKLTSLDLSGLGFGTANVTTMHKMFCDCSGLATLDLSHFNTANVTDMSYMFHGSGLTTLDLSHFNTAKVENMGNMFSGCSQLASLNVSGFDTQNVTSMAYMFDKCALTSLDLSHFNTAKVVNMQEMFYQCSNLASLDVSGFHTQNLNYTTSMFSGCTSLTTIYCNDTWTPEYSNHMFNDCANLVGGQGFAYDENKINATYANPGATGYFTSKTAILQLADNADNSSALSTAGTDKKTVQLSGRTLFKNGTWNTLCLPFDVSADQIAAHADFAGATLMTLDVTKENGFDAEDGTLHLWFKTATAIEAGVPYLVKWDKAADYDNDPSAYDIVSPVFKGVNVSSTEAQTVESETTGLETVKMVGCYSPVSLTANDKSTLYMGGANTLYYPTVDLLIGSCRAFFSIPYIQKNVGARVSAITLNFGEDVVTTSIHNSQFIITTPPLGGWGAYYSLDGRKLSGKPTQRGMYINKGKKILVK